MTKVSTFDQDFDFLQLHYIYHKNFDFLTNLFEKKEEINFENLENFENVKNFESIKNVENR